MKKNLLFGFGFYLLLFSFFKSEAQQNPNLLDYKDQIGYLTPSNKDWSKNFERCAKNMPVGQYSSSAEIIFNPNKRAFRKFILKNFNENDFTDTGILNLRFLINCKGEIGDVEVNELDFDFEPNKLDVNLVQKLKQLSFRRENWNYNILEKPLDFYMYLIFRIENGKVVEILP